MRVDGFLGVAAACVVAFGLSGCTSDGETAPGSTRVTMTGSALGVEPAALPHGRITFEVRNDGHHALHQLLVLRTDLHAAELPVVGGVEYDLTGLEVVGELEGLASESAGTVTLQLEPGHYVLVCEMEGHDHGDWFAADFDVTH